MLSIFVFPLCLLLPSVAGSGFPDFGEDYDYDYVCEGGACARSNIHLRFDKNIQVPNQTVTYEEYESFDVNTVGLLADCAPSLSVGDIASRMKSCKEVHWKYEDACKYRKKGWLDQDGKTVNESLGTDFMAIEGVSENILKCLDWDGDYYWDGHYDYYYNELEESDDVKVRAKRDQISNLPEFMIQKTRLIRSIDKKANIQKEENRLVKKRGTKKGKNNGQFGRKSERKGKKSGKKGKNHDQRRKQSARKGNKWGKTRRKSGKKSGNGRRKSEKRNINHLKKTKKKNQSQNRKKTGNNRKNKNKKEKEERKKKKKERKLLKELGYDSMPSEEMLYKLECVEMAIQYGLEKCGEKIFQKVDRP